MIVLDTSVLSLAFRRRAKSAGEAPAASALRRLIEEDAPVVIPGIVAQELLSGIRSIEQFNRLRGLLDGFSLMVAGKRHHVLAADIANRCRWAGVSASTIDCLIAAQTIDLDAELLTTDSDFEIVAQHCGLRLLGV